MLGVRLCVRYRSAPIWLASPWVGIARIRSHFPLRSDGHAVKTCPQSDPLWHRVCVTGVWQIRVSTVSLRPEQLQWPLHDARRENSV